MATGASLESAVILECTPMYSTCTVLGRQKSINDWKITFMFLHLSSLNNLKKLFFNYFICIRSLRNDKKTLLNKCEDISK